jgi:hypothetical protein
MATGDNLAGYRHKHKPEACATAHTLPNSTFGTSFTDGGTLKNSCG